MIAVYELSNGSVRRIDVTEWGPVPPADGAIRWARVVGAEDQEFLALLGALGLPSEDVVELLDRDVQARVVAHPQSLVAVMPLLGGDTGPADVLRLACTPALLATWEPRALPRLDRTVDELGAASGHDVSVAAVVVDLLEAAVDGGGATYLALRHELEDLAEAIERNPVGIEPAVLLAMKRRVTSLFTAWEGQSYCLIEIKRRRSHVSESRGAREQLRDLVSDANLGLKLLAHLEARVRDLRLHHAHCLQESANRRLNLLAILSAVYLPATLIAGIYGMNFERIPMTHLTHGYLAVMTLMGIVVVGQWWYFRRRGWFE